MQYVVEGVGPPNPKFKAAEELVKGRAGVQNLFNGIRTVAQDYRRAGKQAPLDYSVGALLEDERMLELEKKAFAMYCAWMNAKESLPVMPDPEPRNTLYSRITSAVEFVVDVASGVDLPRAQTEQCLALVPHVCTDLATGMSVADAVAHYGTDVVYTSNNGLTQISLDEEALLTDTDGLHIMPDVVELLKQGIAKEVGTDQVVVYTSSGGHWRDRVSYLRGKELRFGYLGINTYKPRRMELRFDGDWVKGEYCFDTMSSPDYHGVGGSDLGAKIDGEMYELSADGSGLCVINSRGSDYRVGTVEPGVAFRLLVERVEVGGRLFWFCLRVVGWRGYSPFHSTVGLEEFVSRVKMRIDGEKLRAPLRWLGGASSQGAGPYFVDGVSIPVDGLIVRRGKRDLYRKTVWTVDLSDDPRLLLEDRGFHVEMEPPDFAGGVSEYSVRCVGYGHFVFKFVRKRNKTYGNTLPQIVDMMEAL